MVRSIGDVEPIRESLSLVGRCLVEHGKYEEAKKKIEEACLFFPALENLIHNYNLLGWIYSC